MAQNPKTLERVPVPAKRTVKFKVGRKMRDAMESPETQPEASSSVEPKGTANANARAKDDHEVIGSIGSEHMDRTPETAGVR